MGSPVDKAQAVVGVLRNKDSAAEPSTLSERSLADSQAEMGYGTTRPLERVMASCGLLTSAELEFVAADDVPNGGVLCALPFAGAEPLPLTRGVGQSAGAGSDAGSQNPAPKNL